MVRDGATSDMPNSKTIDRAISVTRSRSCEAPFVMRPKTTCSAADARGADGVELVDEDDRGSVLPCVLEQLPNSCGAETGEHLHERRCARGVEVRARRARDRL